MAIRTQLLNGKSDHLLYLCATLVLIIFYFLNRPDAPYISFDTTDYQAVAADLRDNGQLDHLPLRPVGYPLVLILTDAVEKPFRQLYLFQLVIYALSISMLVHMLSRFSVSRIGITLFLLLAWMPPSVNHTAHMLTETVTLFCITVGLCALILYGCGSSGIWCVAGGLLLSFVVIVRPTYLLVVPTLILMLCIGHFTFRLASGKRIQVLFILAAMIIPYLLIVGGHVLYNSVHFGFASIDPSTGFRLNTRTVRFVEYLPDEYAVERDILVQKRDARLLHPGRFELHTATQYIWNDGTIEALMTATDLSYVDLSRRMLKANLTLIANDPLAYSRDVVASLATFWYPNPGWGIFNTPLIRNLWLIIHMVLMSIYFVTSAMLWLGLCMIRLTKQGQSTLSAIWRGHGTRIIYLVITATMIWQTALISSMVEVGDRRYRVPVDLLIYSSIVLYLVLLRDIRQQILIHATDTT